MYFKTVYNYTFECCKQTTLKIFIFLEFSRYSQRMSGFIPAALKIEVQTYLFSGHLFQIDDKFCQNQFSH